MKESGSNRLATRKSPSMPHLTIVGGDGSSFPESSKAPSSTTTTTRKAFHRKVQSTISLCVVMLLFTIVLFVLCTLDPSKVPEDTWKLNGSGGSKMTMTMIPHRPWRVLQETQSTSQASTRNKPVTSHYRQVDIKTAALEGMGSLLRKGKQVMYELVVAHLSDDTTAEDLRFFLRGLHRSGMPARADVVLLFPWRPLPSEMLDVIYQEEEYFHSILAEYRARTIPVNVAGSRGIDELSSVQESKLSVFNSAAYLRPPPASDIPKGRQDSIWGATATLGNDSNAKGSSNHHNNKNDVDARDNGFYHGAILAFDMLELDPDDALSGFIDRPPADLRRWVCYQILLGMVRHRYRHVFLTEVRGVFILKDILAPVKKKDNGLYLYYPGQRWGDPAEIDHHEDASNRMTQKSSKSTADVSSSIDHTGDESQLSEKVDSSKKNFKGGAAANRRLLVTAGSELPTSKPGIMESVYGQAFWNALEGEDKTRKVIGTGVIMGGIRPVRSVAAAMATEIVRVALLRKSRKPFKDEALMSFLVHKSSVLGRKVASHLQIHDSGEGSINLVPGPPRSPQANFDDFFRRADSRFAVIQGLKNPGVAQKRRDFIMNSLHNDICHPQLDSQVYPDCNTVVPLPSS